MGLARRGQDCGGGAASTIGYGKERLCEMLTRLKLTNLTVFAEANFEFAPGLNVVVGENGSGKSHLLKVAYAIGAVSARGLKESGSARPAKEHLKLPLAKKLRGVFRPDRLGRLARRQASGSRVEIAAEYATGTHNIAFSFDASSESELRVERCPEFWDDKPAVFLPTRELLTIYPGFVSLYETTDIPFEETWRDTCILLGAPLIKEKRRLEKAERLLRDIESQLRGTVQLDTAGRFYLQTMEGLTFESHLVAEGLRKLATVARLVRTGALIDRGYLFWDEPDANLNPKIIRGIARTILRLCLNGIQVFIATHSLFLMRELDILLRTDDFREVAPRFFGLHPGDEGVRVEQGATIDDIGQIDSLQEDLNQSDRYLDVEGA